MVLGFKHRTLDIEVLSDTFSFAKRILRCRATGSRAATNGRICTTSEFNDAAFAIREKKEAKSADHA
jgi:hypothetical protein